MNEHDWREVAEQEMGVHLGDWRSLSGGDFAQSWQSTVKAVSSNNERAPLADKHDCIGAWLTGSKETARPEVGTKLFVKSHQNPPPRHFTTEAMGLAWLADSAAVRVPTVLGVSDETPYLALQWVEEGGASSMAEEQFGHELAELHRSPCERFGRDDERTTGSLGLPNKPTDVWAQFYASERLMPLVKIAYDRQALNKDLCRDIETLAQQLDNWVPADERPSRLHGDLWAGNRLIDTAGQSWLIDPASHGGHREFDLAMMRLFGGFSEACHSAYANSYPLSAGWQERVALHQLAPLIVHAIKFGHSYVEPTRRALAQYV
ncbi:MAG: fructosamine kinase family protein [Granulosicoccus sp.]